MLSAVHSDMQLWICILTLAPREVHLVERSNIELGEGDALRMFGSLV